MVWDMLCRGSFQRRDMTNRGRMATAARPVQPDSECRFNASPAMETADTQTIAMMALIETRFMYCKCRRRGLKRLFKSGQAGRYAAG